MNHNFTLSLAKGLFALAQQMQKLGFLSALLIVVFRFEKFNFIAQLFAITALIGIAPGLLFWGAREIALWKFDPLTVNVIFPPGSWYVWAVSTGCGFALILVWLRWGIQWIDIFWSKLTRRSLTQRDLKTDVREIHKLLPKAIGTYDPAKYFNFKKGIFLGLDERKKAIYLPWEDWRLSHLLLTGRTRVGKGVAAQILLSQAIQAGELVVILDPKPDDWLPHNFFQAAAQADLPYHFFNLTPSSQPQFNLFAGLNAEDTEGILIGGLGLGEKGEAADFYRLADRKAAREAAVWIQSHLGSTPRNVWLANTEKWSEAAPAFNDYMRELAELPAVNASVEFDMRTMLKTGGCVYFAGDMMNPRVVRVQRMILIRLMQIAKNRTDRNRTITVLADEFKVHISKPFMTCLGAAAGWNLHAVLSFQSLQDLADCPSDLDKDGVRGAVMENCGLQLSYRIKDPETAEWLSRSTGTILVDDESRRVKRNAALSEEVDAERSIRQAERNFIDENMFMNLPKGCGVLTGAATLAKFCYTSPMNVQKNGLAITPASFSSKVDSQQSVVAEHQCAPSGAAALFDV